MTSKEIIDLIHQQKEIAAQAIEVISNVDDLPGADIIVLNAAYNALEDLGETATDYANHYMLLTEE